MILIQEQKAKLERLVAELLEEARGQGAETAEAAVSQDAGLSVTVRMGAVETVEHTRDRGLGVTVYFGTRKGSASTTDLSLAAVRDTVRAACNIARHTQEDPCAGLAEADLMAWDPPDLDLYHPWGVSAEQAIALALESEHAARALDPRITNSEGASLNSHAGLHIYGNSHGFTAGYPSSRHSLSCAVLGQEGDGTMQRDYWWTTARAPEDLEPTTEVGRKAAERVLARLGARRLSTRTAPVVFQADVAAGLLRSLIGAIRGPALYRKASFLVDQLGQQIFPAFVHIHESPQLPRGLGSAPFDNEGVATRARDLVTSGVLQGYVLDSYSGRKLGMRTTGNAGGVHNLTIDAASAAGQVLDRDGMRRTLGTGLWVTELMGHGVNIVTGDYSRGAAGFWVENGEIAYPVEEITIAGHLREMFRGLQAVGSDVDTRGSTRTGSWLIDRMTIAGE
jgi:PmbA protein